jgi:fatty acid desaturase
MRRLQPETFEVFSTEECRADQAEARSIARAFDRMIRDDAAANERERVAGYRLAAEWYAILGITFGLLYGVRPIALKIALLVPWSIYASLALDNITHYANHWPLFRSRWANALFRWSGALVFFNPLEIRAIHNDHHRAYARADNDERVFPLADRESPAAGASAYWRYLLVGALDGLRLLWPLRAMDASVKALRERRPEQYREVVAMRWAQVAWFALLVALDARDTLLFYVPAVLLMGSLGSLVMNLTDHIPGDARHPFRLATWLEPSTPVERVLSSINHYTAATHLSHHLFPTVHWLHLPALQQRLAPIYTRQGAPRSLLVTSVLVGNPLRFAALLLQVCRRRFDLR